MTKNEKMTPCWVQDANRAVNLARAIHVLCQRRNVSLPRLAKVTQVSLNTLTRLEQVRIEPASLSRLLDWCEDAEEQKQMVAAFLMDECARLEYQSHPEPDQQARNATPAARGASASATDILGQIDVHLTLMRTVTVRRSDDTEKLLLAYNGMAGTRSQELRDGIIEELLRRDLTVREPRKGHR